MSINALSSTDVERARKVLDDLEHGSDPVVIDPESTAIVRMALQNLLKRSEVPKSKINSDLAPEECKTGLQLLRWHLYQMREGTQTKKILTILSVKGLGVPVSVNEMEALFPDKISLVRSMIYGIDQWLKKNKIPLAVQREFHHAPRRGHALEYYACTLVEAPEPTKCPPMHSIFQ